MLPPVSDDDWPDPADLCRGLLAALSTQDPAAADWAGELLLAVDRAIGNQLAAVITAHPFARVEAAWRGVAAVVAETPATPTVEVQTCDVAAADWAADDDLVWLHRLLYAGPLDTRGGRPISVLILGQPVADVARVAAVAERAVCPVVAPGEPVPGVGPFVSLDIRSTTLRPPPSADPVWAAWFGWPSAAADLPLNGTAAYAIAAEAVRSVVRFGWPIDVPTARNESLPRLLMAARLAQIAAVQCRELIGRPPTDVAAELADALRGRYVGPRLPLRWVDVTAAVSGGRLVCTLRLSPRLGGADPDDVPLTLRVELAGG